MFHPVKRQLPSQWERRGTGKADRLALDVADRELNHFRVPDFSPWYSLSAVCRVRSRTAVLQASSSLDTLGRHEL